MADLTADAPLRIWGQASTDKWALDTSSAQTIYKGQPMILDLSADTVNAVGYVDSIVVAATDIFVGIAAEGASVESAAAETTEVEVYVWPSIIGFKSTVFTDADVGDTVYMSDSGTLSATAADNPVLGVLFRVIDGYAYVRIDSPAITTGA
jgi:hypothetical protein